MLRKLFATLAIAIAILMSTTTYAQNFLEEEAGITAYVNVGRTIDLEQVKPLYRTIEQETEDYIVGSVPIPDYDETEDAHVYVQKDGWIAAYYLRDEPTSKIMDLAHYNGGAIVATKLDNALLTVADLFGVAITEVRYYHFGFPEADQLLIVADREATAATDSFNITIPNEIIVSERSWGITGLTTWTRTLHLNEDIIITSTSLEYGKLTPNQLRQSISHTIKVQNHDARAWTAGGITLVYKKP